jgi:hypothetical protein
MDMEIEVDMHVLTLVRVLVEVALENRDMTVIQIDFWQMLTVVGNS